MLFMIVKKWHYSKISYVLRCFLSPYSFCIYQNQCSPNLEIIPDWNSELTLCLVFSRHAAIVLIFAKVTDSFNSEIVSQIAIIELVSYKYRNFFIQSLQSRGEVPNEMSSQPNHSVDFLMEDGLDGKTLFGAGDGLTYEWDIIKIFSCNSDYII